MITTDHQEGLISVAVFGEFSLADFKEFDELVRFKLKFEGPQSLLIDLRQMADFTLDVAWEEIRFSRQHQQDFLRIAVLTDSHWITWSAWFSQAFVDADLRVFAEDADARAWLAELRRKT